MSPNVRGRGWQDRNGYQADRTRTGVSAGGSANLDFIRLATQERTSSARQVSTGAGLYVETPEGEPFEFASPSIELTLPSGGWWIVSSAVDIDWTDASPADGDVASFTANIVGDPVSVLCADKRTITYETGNYTPYAATPGGLMLFAAATVLELQVSSSLAAGTWSGPGHLSAFLLAPSL